jgi:hypothetical protein
MLLHRSIKILIAYTTVLTIVCVSQCAAASNDLDEHVKKLYKVLGNVSKADSSNSVATSIGKVLTLFNEVLESDNEATRATLKQWDDYALTVLNYSNNEYLDAISEQQAGYHKAIAELGKLIEKTRKMQKQEYSSAWVDDLVEHFGKNYLKQNKAAILWSLQAIYACDITFESMLKDLIYTETMLYGSYRKYFNSFLDFYREKIDAKAKKNLESRKVAAESFLAIIDEVSFASMHEDTVLRKILAENKARQLNDEVFMFLKNHRLSHTFGDLRASEDLRKAIEY